MIFKFTYTSSPLPFLFLSLRNEYEYHIQLVIYDLACTMSHLTPGIDSFRPFPCTKKGNVVALTCVDCFMHWPIFIALRDMKAETVAQAFNDDVICEHSCPCKILSDRGTQFLAELVRQICRIFEVKQLYSSGYTN